MKKLFFLIVLVLISSLILAGTVEIWSWRAQDEDVWKEVEAKLQAEGKDIKIDFRGFLATEYDSKMLLALQGGEGPDIAYTRRLPGGRTQALIESGLIKSLAADVDFSNFTESVLKSITFQGEEYGVPFAVQVVGIFYNKDMFDEFGFEEPETWGELLEIADGFKQAGIDPFFAPVKDAWAIVMQHASAGVSILQPEWIEKLAKGETNFLDPEWINMNQYMYDLKQYFQKGFSGNSTSDLESAFAFGVSPMVFYGIWGVQMWQELNPDINVGYFMVPPISKEQEPYAYVYMDGSLGLTSSCDNAEDTMEVLKFAATPEFGTIFSNITLNIPGVSGADMPDVPILQEVNEVAENHASPWVYWVGSDFVTGKPSLYSDILSPGLQELYADKITPEELAQRCQDGLSQWYGPLMDK
ncbi:MAG: raffinose/stachyose/melibiose transport system substrate-binding protein [Kosmotogales bacterium]|nr:raffinose/stachyose/melibiose transport system substrate-binding protein [Kosmotogales bacterium]